METMLLIGIIAVVALLRPAPQTQVISVPLAIEEPSGRLRCAPLIVVGVLVLVVIVGMWG
jgi:hypothetical protein